MNRQFCASNKNLERKWQNMAYQRHREKLKSIKPRIYQEVHKNKEEEEYRVRRRITRVLDEERRQEVIAKQNQKFLVRLLDIMGSPSRLDTWNIEYMNKQNILAERKLRENDQYITKTKKSTMKKRRKIHLPALQ
ncbi:uncharacterized protein LOC124442910 isoform X2 [Xenia sp. Carnegie-2017]|uniref:uncharacterized protein LOC124442910 isoform X2 n=1 Tax=Xenia sp. Carnegie-2017 TaxID=2897299 RepID=UPI001F0396DA|nr:uncharacterized protein LOC124442910 isoform X2 [Xenia sp. Carnegie-2017]